MTNSSAPSTYSKAQIRLHWIVAALIAYQIIGHEYMNAVYDAIAENSTPASIDMILARGHVIAGIAIWFFAAWRLYLRFTRGVPKHLDDGTAWTARVSDIIHIVLYAALLLMPISGSVAWFLGVEQAGEVHSLARFVLLPAVLLHIAGALAQHFYFKNDTLRRMVKPVND